MATVHPGPGEDISTVAATLLGLAGDPRQVVFLAGDAAFEVPDDLADKYIQQGREESAPAAPRKAAPRKAAPRRAAQRAAQPEPIVEEPAPAGPEDAPQGEEE